jgi:hypothetical protein
VSDVQVEWEPEELIEAWTLRPGDWDLVGNKAGATRLGFVAMLKFYELEGRFPGTPRRCRRRRWSTWPRWSRLIR